MSDLNGLNFYAVIALDFKNVDVKGFNYIDYFIKLLEMFKKEVDNPKNDTDDMKAVFHNQIWPIIRKYKNKSYKISDLVDYIFENTA
jgi:hypothetical protein